MRALHDHLIQVMKVKETLLKNVLREYLDREPTPEDAKKVTIGRISGNTNYELLMYDNEHLGRIEMSQPQELVINIKFIPEES